MQYSGIKTMAFMRLGENIKLVITTKSPTFDAMLTVHGVTYMDSFNDDEPYDRKTHVFYFPLCGIRKHSVLKLRFKKFRHGLINYEYSFAFGEPEFAEKTELIAEYDNALKAVSDEKETVCEGVTYTHTLYNDKCGAPVHAFVTEIKKGCGYIYVGTPNDSYESVGVRATIPDMAKSAINNGKNIVAAVNADFFDIFGNFHPAGLCVKNGTVVANPDSRRNFIAQLKDGSHIITSLVRSPEIKGNILHAASGLQMIVFNGEIYDYAPLEPFSFTRHPRTAVGVRKNGDVVLLVVDGRIPDYSNGASLVDLAKIMISLGCDRAINLDGGGSSAIYTKEGGELVLHSRPADLFRPTAKLIRKDYNSLLVEIK